MIKKEILEEIFELKVKKVINDVSIIKYNINGLAKKGDIAIVFKGGHLIINENALANEIKKWAFKKRYWLSSYIDTNEGVCSIRDFDEELNDVYARHDTEASSVFTAARWIYEELQIKENAN